MSTPKYDKPTITGKSYLESLKDAALKDPKLYKSYLPNAKITKWKEGLDEPKKYGKFFSPPGPKALNRNAKRLNG